MSARNITDALLEAEGSTPQPSPLTDMADAEDTRDETVIRAKPPPPVAPLSDFELETRQRLAAIESHQARLGVVVVDVQREQRADIRGIESRLDAKLGSIAAAISRLAADVARLVRLGTNGDASHG